ncbi:MAG: CPBP family intramembrane metalloprotease [Clostridia bacterium]|nr:CPBP family intramembrane metalloprotease [Clostridia bacterium]
MERPLGYPPQVLCSPPPSRGRSVGAGFMYLGIYFGVQTLASLLYAVALVVTTLLNTGALDPEALIGVVNEKLVLLSGVTNILTLVVLWIVFAARRCSFGAETGLRRVHAPALLILLPLGLCSYVFVCSALALLPSGLLESYSESSSTLMTGLDFLPMLCLVVLAPLAEEVVFRGLVYSRWKRGMGRFLATLLTGAIFGLLHGQLVWAVYTFAFSLLLTGVYEWYDSLWASVLLHACFNAGQYVSGYLEGLSAAPALVCSGLLLAALVLLARRAGLAARR